MAPQCKIANCARLIHPRASRDVKDTPVIWRGSVSDFVTDLKPLLTDQERYELAIRLLPASIAAELRTIYVHARELHVRMKEIDVLVRELLKK